jgi:hypothetical protein
MVLGLVSLRDDVRFALTIFNSPFDLVFLASWSLGPRNAQPVSAHFDLLKHHRLLPREGQNELPWLKVEDFIFKARERRLKTRSRDHSVEQPRNG